MQKSIFITGIAGLIGSSLAKHYLLKGWKVTGCDSLIGGYEDNVPKAIKWIKKDIMDADFEVLFKRHHQDLRNQTFLGYDVIAHTASLPYEGLSVFSPELIVTSIISPTIKMAELAIKNKAKMFINFSSMARYGNIIAPFYEDAACNPVDPYGLAKLQAEQQLELLSDIYPEFNFYTVVPHNVCGPHQVYTDPFRNVMSIMIHQSLAKLPIFIYGDGEQKRSFSHVDDCVKAIDVLIETQPEHRVFNIGPDSNEITIAELARLVLDRTNNTTSKIVNLPDRPREVKNAWCSSDLARDFLNYKIAKPISIIIDETIKFITLRGLESFNYHLPIVLQGKELPVTWRHQLFGNYWYDWEDGNLQEQLRSYEDVIH